MSHDGPSRAARRVRRRTTVRLLGVLALGTLVLSAAADSGVSAVFTATSSTATSTLAAGRTGPLPAPAGLTASAGGSTVTATWQRVSEADSYDVYYSGPDGKPVQAAAGVKNTTSTFDVPAAGSYAFWTVAHRTREPALTSADSARVPLAVLAQPRNLTLTSDPTKLAVDVAWEPVTNATSYRVVRTGGTQGTVTFDVTSPAVRDPGPLTRGERYTYVVTAYATNSVSASRTVTTLIEPLPGPATITTTTGRSKAIDVTWTQSTSGAAPVDYLVAAKPTTAGCTTGASLVLKAPATSAALTGLVDGCQYEVTLTPRNVYGEGSTTSSTARVGTAPAAPTAVSAAPRDGVAQVTWTPPTNTGGWAITKYVITYTWAGGTGTLEVPAPATTATVAGLTNGTVYAVKVAAVTAFGTGAASSSVNVTPNPQPPAAPVVTGAPGNMTVTLSWQPDANATSFTIEQWDGKKWVVLATTSATTYQVARLTNGTAYTFRVTATNKAYSTPSASAGPWTPVNTYLKATTVSTVNTSMHNPEGVTFDVAGNMYVADTGKNVILKVTPGGVTTTIAGISGSRGSVDGALGIGKLDAPVGITFGPDGALYIADDGTLKIRKLVFNADGTPGALSTYAGAGGAGYVDGPLATAKFTAPTRIAFAADGTMYVTDKARIRRIAPGTGTVTSWLTFPAGTDARGLAFLPDGSLAAATDAMVFKLTATAVPTVLWQTGFTTTGKMADGGNGGQTGDARFATILDLTIGRDGYIYVSDGNGARGHRVARVNPATGWVDTLAGSNGGTTDGTGDVAKFNNPRALAFAPDAALYVASSNDIRKVLVPAP